MIKWHFVINGNELVIDANEEENKRLDDFCKQYSDMFLTVYKDDMRMDINLEHVNVIVREKVKDGGISE